MMIVSDNESNRDLVWRHRSLQHSVGARDSGLNGLPALAAAEIGHEWSGFLANQSGRVRRGRILVRDLPYAACRMFHGGVAFDAVVSDTGRLMSVSGTVAKDSLIVGRNVVRLLLDGYCGAWAVGAPLGAMPLSRLYPAVVACVVLVVVAVLAPSAEVRTSSAGGFFAMGVAAAHVLCLWWLIWTRPKWRLERQLAAIDAQLAQRTSGAPKQPKAEA